MRSRHAAALRSSRRRGVVSAGAQAGSCKTRVDTRAVTAVQTHEPAPRILPTCSQKSALVYANAARPSAAPPAHAPGAPPADASLQRVSQARACKGTLVSHKLLRRACCADDGTALHNTGAWVAHAVQGVLGRSARGRRWAVAAWRCYACCTCPRAVWRLPAVRGSAAHTSGQAAPRASPLRRALVHPPLH